jgi:hypothetical protein
MDVDVPDDADYIVETYVRVPVESLSVSLDPASMGLLVLDAQEDLEEFYADEGDSDSDLYDDEEDENAENHYTADYPDEVDEAADSEDGEGDGAGGGYGGVGEEGDAYRYRRNASDEEEWGSGDEGNFSDEESKKPWERRPWLAVKEKYLGKAESDDEY